MRYLASAVAAVAWALGVLAAPCSPARAADAATQLYVAAVAAMQALPQPPFMIYGLVAKSDDNLKVQLRVINHDVWLGFDEGWANTTWSVVHRSSDFRSLIVDENGRSYVTNRSFFDPTWYSSYHAMRDGMFFNSVSGTQPDQRAVPTPAPTPTPDSALKTIAIEQSSNGNLYSAQDAGPATCPNGDAGRALRFTPRGSPMQYQLTAAVVDLAPKLFCVMQFTLPAPGNWLVDDQYFSMVEGYWIRTGGEFRRTIRSRFDGEPAVLTLRYQLNDITFPDILPDDLFVTPPGQ